MGMRTLAVAATAALALAVITATAGAQTPRAAAPRVAAPTDDRLPQGTSPLKLPIDPLGLNNKHGGLGGAGAGSNPLANLNEDILAKLLADATYAAARADATKNTVTAPCWHALADLLKAQSQPLTDSSGATLAKPDPHFITDAEMVSEFLRQLQPDSPLSLACAGTLQAAQKDIATLIGGVLSGGALGLFKLPVIP